MADPIRPEAWNQVNSMWTLSLGSRGMRVRLFQKRKDGVFFRATWIAGVGRDQLSLGTTDRDEAERLGRELFTAMIEQKTPPAAGVVRLTEVWRRYRTECATHLDNTLRTVAYESSLIERVIRFFGRNYDVRKLSALEWRRYELARRAGHIRKADGSPSRPVGDRSVHGDFVMLRTVLRWACQVPTADGGRWLERDPLQGVKVEQEKNPRRPIASWARFEKTRAALLQLASQANDLLVKHRWIKIEFALVIAEATGRRLGSIRALEWEDFDFEQGRIVWRAETDKRGNEWIVPMPEALRDAVAEFRDRLGATTGPVFIAERGEGKIMNRRQFLRWLDEAEQHAGLRKMRMGSWHPYRRKWATERKRLPLVDVAAVGGWKGTQMLLKCYQQPDPDTILAVMNEPQKLGQQWDAATSRGAVKRPPTAPRLRVV
jgi:integrase